MSKRGQPRSSGGDLVDERIKEFCTTQQAQTIDAVNAADGHRGNAAKALGIPYTTLKDRVQTAEKKAAPYLAAVRGPSGNHATTPPVQLAEGQELKRQTVHVNAKGQLLDRYDLSQAIRNPPAFEPVPEGHHVTKTTTVLGPDGRASMQYVSAKHEDAARERAFWEACAANAAKYVGLAAAVPVPKSCDADTLVAYPIGDPHIGQLSWAPETGDHFDVAIACRELLACIRELVDRSPPAEHAIVCNLGDALHAQDDMARTPGHGNVLDVDGRFAKVLEAAHTVFRGIADAALAKHKHVTFRNLPGNHDPRVAVELMMWLRAVYANEPRITIADAYAAHQYDRFGTNLLGWHHGDRSRKGELPAIMASDHDGGGTGWWGETTEHVWHVGHEHHTTVLETPSCFVWVHNTLAGRDAYHAGRYRAKRMLRAFTYHKEYGEDAIATVSLARVRAALKAAA